MCRSKVEPRQGQMCTCLDGRIGYALDRKQFNNPRAKYQLIQKKVAGAITDIPTVLLGLVRIRIFAVIGYIRIVIRTSPNGCE
ncbi:hypothetical protein V1527DRAFT_472919 [Lipomyces starkeyi]